ncbi:MAG TPA: indolepyruvate ferredoxin oxidoreductase subunit alpha, partial [Nitrososphaeria archaeon]|nr:indolepyruvate ferredoxin oxidoreductase subunit alpha [Nitrososphaeria archaeon]
TLNVVAVIGDSSFYHNGLQGLLNAFYHRIPIVVLVLDNMITAQTGFQPDPGSGVTAMGEKASKIPLESLLSFMGDKVRIVNAFDFQEVEEALIEALKSGECRVVISRGGCPLIER